MGASTLRSVDKVDPESDTDSTGFPSDYSGPGPTSTSEGQEQETKERKGKGHYRGITFEDILPPDLIANAPPLDVDQKRGRLRPKSIQLPLTPSSTTTDRRSPTSTKRNYPPLKQYSPGKSRFHTTARALVRRLTRSKKSKQRRNGYESV